MTIIEERIKNLLKRKHGVVQYAHIIEIDGKVVDEYACKIKPFPDVEIVEEALAVNGIDLNDPELMDPVTVWKKQIKPTYDLYIDKYNPKDKFVLSGYNIMQFDMPFYRAWINRCDPHSKYSVAGSYIGHNCLDPLPVLNWMKVYGMFKGPSLKLIDVCKALDIPFEDAHDALADIRVTRQVVMKLKSWLFTVPTVWDLNEHITKAGSQPLIVGSDTFYKIHKMKEGTDQMKSTETRINTEAPGTHRRICLGDLVKDKVTELEGICTARVEYLNGCVRIGVTPRKLRENGLPNDAYYIDEYQLDFISVTAVKPVRATTNQPGGDRRDPSQMAPPG